MTRRRFPLTYAKACYVLWLVHREGLSQTHASLFCGLNSGTVSHVIAKHRFPEAVPIPPPGFF